MSKKSSAHRTRRVFNFEFKTKVALAALREDKALAQLCQQYELHPNQISDWRRQLLIQASKIFDSGQTAQAVGRPQPVLNQPTAQRLGAASKTVMLDQIFVPR